MTLACINDEKAPKDSITHERISKSKLYCFIPVEALAPSERAFAHKSIIQEECLNFESFKRILV